MPLSRTQEGGALMIIDAANYLVRHARRRPAWRPAAARSRSPPSKLDDGAASSLNGRVTTPYPLWDGSDRVLLAYRPCGDEERRRLLCDS